MPMTEKVDLLLDRRVVDLQSLFELSRTISSSSDLKKILDTLLLTPMGRMLITRGAILLHTGKNLFKVYTIKGLPQQLIGRVIAVEQPLNEILHIDKQGDRSKLRFFVEHRLHLICPIRHDEKCLGLLVLGEKIDQQPFGQDELAYLDAMANLAAPVVNNQRYLNELKEVNRQLDKKNQELKTLFEIGTELNSTLDKNIIANTLAYAIMGEMMVQHCVVFLQNVDGEMETLVCKGVEKDHVESVLRKQEAVDAILQTRLPKEVAQLEPALLSESMAQKQLELFIPMLSQDRVKGGIFLGKRLNEQPFSATDLEFLATLANAAMTSFENARLFQEAIEKERLEEELSIARDIQRKLLPASAPIIEGFEFAGMNIPTRKVGGDYYDFILVDDQHIVVAIGDVSGKGVPASLLMANLQASLHAMIHAGWPLKEVVRRINNIIHKNTAIDKFITFFIAEINTETHELTYVNAGHNPPMWVNQNGEIRLLETGGVILGMMPAMPYQQETISLAPNDWLVLFTDGVSEAMNEQDEEFTEQRIEATIRENLDLSARQMIEKIATAVREFCGNAPQSDDITLVAIHLLQPQK